MSEVKYDFSWKVQKKENKGSCYIYIQSMGSGSCLPYNIFHAGHFVNIFVILSF